MEASNAQKMREALEYAHDTWVKMYEYIEEVAQPHLLQVLADAGKCMESALAAPPRNCDVGTADEQAWRFNEVCRHNYCRTCPVYKVPHVDCGLAWAQMPYEEGDAK